jgi:hypothetical protein
VGAPELLNGRELADRLGVNAKSLRAVIRKHDLVPSHQRGEHYRLDADEQDRIAAHPAVRRLVADSRG